MTHEIDSNEWHTCKICNSNIKDLAKKYGGNGIYFTKVFKEHLNKDHNINPEKYFEEILTYCPCGVCNKKLGIKSRGSKFYIKKYACGRNPGLLEWSEQAKETRKGSGNPMFEKTPWNQGLTKETNDSVLASAIKNKNKVYTKETRLKQSESAKKRLFHGHTGRHHTPQTKEFLRKNTLRLIKEGVFKQTKTKPHLALKDILDELNIRHEEEKTVSYWSFDFYLIDYNVYIEVDGDYWHSNPKIYPNGPKSKSQKINYARDISKNEFCKENNLHLIRFWESDILSFKEEIICTLKKLLK